MASLKGFDVLLDLAESLPASPVAVVAAAQHWRAWSITAAPGAATARAAASTESHWRTAMNARYADTTRGWTPGVDSYSGFRNNWDRNGDRPLTGLTGYLRERHIARCFICGLARDVCVKLSAEDSVAARFETYRLWGVTRPVEPKSEEAVRAGLRAHGVQIIESEELNPCSAS
jgi:nicotinamidase-related amidase